MSRKISVASTKNTTTKDTLYTIPVKNTALWSLMYIVSLTSNETPKVYWYDSSTNTEYFVVGGKNLGVGESIILNQADVALKEKDEIRIQNTGTNTVTYIATLELVPNLATQFHGG